MVINRMMLNTRLSILSQNNIAINQAGLNGSEKIMKISRKGLTAGRVMRLNNEPNYHSEISNAEDMLDNRMGIAEQIREAQNHINHLRAERARLAEQLQSARELAEAQAEAFRKQQIAMEIAARIMRGDNVPQSDKDFLLKHSPGLYKLAMATRNHENDNPEDHDALAECESSSGSEAAVQATMNIISSQTSASVSSSSATTGSSAASL